jgi:hypothetical protein
MHSIVRDQRAAILGPLNMTLRPIRPKTAAPHKLLRIRQLANSQSVSKAPLFVIAYFDYNYLCPALLKHCVHLNNAEIHQF